MMLDARKFSYGPNGEVNCEVLHMTHGWLPHTIDPNDESGLKDSLMSIAKVVGITEYVPPPSPPIEDIKAEAFSFISKLANSRVSSIAHLLPGLSSVALLKVDEAKRFMSGLDNQGKFPFILAFKSEDALSLAESWIEMYDAWSMEAARIDLAYAAAAGRLAEAKTIEEVDQIVADFKESSNV